MPTRNLAIRGTAVLALAGGAGLALLIALWPTSITVAGDRASCGRPLLTAAGHPPGAGVGVPEVCREQAWGQLLAASIVLGGAAIGSAATTLLQPWAAASNRGVWRPPPGG